MYTSTDSLCSVACASLFTRSSVTATAIVGIGTCLVGTYSSGAWRQSFKKTLTLHFFMTCYFQIPILILNIAMDL